MRNTSVRMSSMECLMLVASVYSLLLFLLTIGSNSGIFRRSFSRNGFGVADAFTTRTHHSHSPIHFLQRFSSSSLASNMSPQQRILATATFLKSQKDPYQFRYDFGVVSRVGSDPNRPQKVNQDAHFITNLTTLENIQQPSFTCVGVMDGHGLRGHVVTEFFAINLPNCLENIFLNQYLPEPAVVEFEEKIRTAWPALFAEDQDSSHNAGDDYYNNNDENHYSTAMIHKALQDAFHQSHVNAMQDPGVPAGRSGSTCIVALLSNTNMGEDDDGTVFHVAHVGDSRAIQFGMQQAQQVGDTNSTAAATALTKETTLAIPAERKRIEQGEGSIVGDKNVFYGPVGIAMTRAIGDVVMLRAGVVPTPIVQQFTWKNTSPTEFIVLATDGIWDVLSNQAVQAIVQEQIAIQQQQQFITSNLDDICRAIADAATQKWIGSLPIMDEAKIDDITCLIVQRKRIGYIE